MVLVHAKGVNLAKICDANGIPYRVVKGLYVQVGAKLVSSSRNCCRRKVGATGAPQESVWQAERVRRVNPWRFSPLTDGRSPRVYRAFLAGDLYRPWRKTQRVQLSCFQTAIVLLGLAHYRMSLPTITIDTAEQFTPLAHAPIVEAIFDAVAPAHVKLEEDSSLAHLKSALPDYPTMLSSRRIQESFKVFPVGATRYSARRWLGWSPMSDAGQVADRQIQSGGIQPACCFRTRIGKSFITKPSVCGVFTRNWPSPSRYCVWHFGT